MTQRGGENWCRDILDLRRRHVRFEDTFESLTCIGNGGFAEVWKVKHKLKGEHYAVKIIKLPDNKELDDKQKRLWKREVQILGLLHDMAYARSDQGRGHYVVNYFDAWVEDRNCLYIQMELSSNDLKNIIEEKLKCFGRKRSGVMTPLEYFISSQLFKELLECVQYLHESKPNFIHRDLKPENVLISEGEQGRFLKLCDFGLATTNGMDTRNRTEGQGTINFMAPEIIDPFNGQVKYSFKCDIFSLGVIAQYLFGFNINHKNKPRNDDKLVQTKKWDGLKEKMTAMINIDPKKRPTCDELLKEFDNWGLSVDRLLDFVSLEVVQDTLSNFDNKFFRDYFDAKFNLTIQKFIVRHSNTAEETTNTAQKDSNPEE